MKNSWFFLKIFRCHLENNFFRFLMWLFSDFCYHSPVQFWSVLIFVLCVVFLRILGSERFASDSTLRQETVKKTAQICEKIHGEFSHENFKKVKKKSDKKSKISYGVSHHPTASARQTSSKWWRCGLDYSRFRMRMLRLKSDDFEVDDSLHYAAV